MPTTAHRDRRGAEDGRRRVLPRRSGRLMGDLLKHAYDCDAKLSAELSRVYGARAGDARYQRDHDDPAVKAAVAAKLAADAALQLHVAGDAWRTSSLADRAAAWVAYNNLRVAIGHPSCTDAEFCAACPSFAWIGS